MMRSLYSGVSGLKNHQTRMDVIGNNIANVNTIGYKTSRVIFQDIYSQNVKAASQGDYGATGVAGNYGGTNPAQIGLGVTLAAIDIIHTSAATQRTDNPTDLAIEGDGFFIIHPNNSLEADDYVGTPVEDGTDFVGTYVDDFLYTRAGNFYLDNQGRVVTSGGQFVMGYQISDITVDDTTGAVTHTAAATPNTLTKIDLTGLTGISFDSTGTVWCKIGEEKVAVAQVAIAMFTNTSGLEKKGESLYAATGNSGTAFATTANTAGAGKINPGGLEMSNVDLASEFTDMIVTQRGFQANSRIITTSDTLLEELVNLKR